MEEGRLCSCTKNHLLPRKYHYGILCYVVGSLATYPDLMNLMTDLILQITLDENFFNVNWHIFHNQNRRHKKNLCGSIQSMKSLGNPRLGLHGPRTSVDMDGTLKFVNYKVRGLKTPIALLKPNIFLIFFGENTFLCT